MTRRKNSPHAYALDSISTMGRTGCDGGLTPNRETITHNPNRVITRITVITSILLTLLGQSYAYAVDLHQQEMWKLYAHMKIGNTKEFICINDLWNMESHWNPSSHNKRSTAYGIPQILDLKTTNPYEQIDAGIRYIRHRYHNGCVALTYHYRHGHY
jgi:hypothetical protein